MELKEQKLFYCLAGLPIPFDYNAGSLVQSEPGKYFYSPFGLFRFRSPLLTESLLISFPRPT